MLHWMFFGCNKYAPWTDCKPSPHLPHLYFSDIFENGLQMLEAETPTSNQEIEIPSFITIEKEVTDNKSYRNGSLYKRMNPSKRGIQKNLKI